MRASLAHRSMRHSCLLAVVGLLAFSAPTNGFARGTAPSAQTAEDQEIKIRPVPAAERAAIRRIIEQQMAAFQKDDGNAAFNLATQQLRAQFGNAENFMRLVRANYQPVYRPSQISFGKMEAVDGTPVAHVLLTGQDGNVVEALYFMKHEKDGTWRIDGCVLTDTDLKSS